MQIGQAPSLRYADYWDAGRVLDYFAWNAAQFKGGSFMFDYLESTVEGDVDMEDRIGALQQLQHGAVVMRIILVHTILENAAKTGLFGLLGDAPIQVVDIFDESRLDALFEFAEKCESDAKGSITRRQDFHRDSSESVQIVLKDKLADTFGAQAAQKLSSIYPAIMFRLCTHWCNHSFGNSQRARDIANIGIGNGGHSQTGAGQKFKSFMEYLNMR
ncbi:uncharacterized protein PFLUO_LOCUS367 [Penicillium psychrofluorescens]|uniref:uncharacterized protein n=1 Tax=Penicillium psychrofluorescens TaxID=3158075 RepID=UPI003CCE49C9